MKSKIIALGIFVVTAVVVALYPKANNTANATLPTPITPVNVITNDKPKIQLAILLDTSSSMSGLINQARNQLWQVVNEFAKSKKNGMTPSLEVAVYEYGNSGLSASNGYIRKVTGLTTELDQVSEALFALTTNGGDEYCGYVIQTAVNELQWSKSDNDIKAIFIAGNEPFNQGPVSYQSAIETAKSRGIKVNTIHAGNHQEGANSGWKDGALFAGGEYMSIDHNHQVVHIDAPQDKKIAEFNAKLNDTYVPYGAQGRSKLERQMVQDKASEEVSAGLLASRVASKSSALYNNATWDLVDALENGSVDLNKLESDQLPAEIQKLSKQQQKDYVQKKAEERKLIKQQITTLSKDRDAYVAEQNRSAGKPAVNTMDDALTAAVRKQGEAKHYVFDSNKKK